MLNRIAGFEWDAGNRTKCQKHGVTIDEIEDLFQSRFLAVEPDVLNSVVEKRYRAIGMTGGKRHVFVVFTLRSRLGDVFIRPISARYMHKKEIETYEKENS
jgi:uncharacterized protein